MKTSYKLSVGLLLFLLVFQGCKKITDIRSKAGDASFFQSEAGATGMVMGIYSKMNKNIGFENGGITLYTGLSSDELWAVFSETSIMQFQTNTLSNDNTLVMEMWGNAFSTLLQINTCIEGLEESNALSPTVKKQLLGETKFCRAFEFFYLVNLWGDVPLVTSTDWKINQSLKRSGKAEIYERVVADLKDALILLMTTYPSSEKIRPNRYAAEALLARVYLYQQDWANAEVMATSVINSGMYSPLPALNKVFLKNSKEAIWQLEPSSEYGATAEGTLFLNESASVPGGEVQPYLLDSSFVNTIEQGDGRKAHWMRKVSHPTLNYYYPYKYRDPGFFGNTKITEYYMVLRAAEQYLIRAEARARQGNTAGAVADLNVIRQRARDITSGVAALPDLPSGLNQGECLLAVEQERRMELFCEWGHRWLDLKRNNRADAVIGSLKAGWKSTAVWYPIPYKEIKANPNLTQNEGY